MKKTKKISDICFTNRQVILTIETDSKIKNLVMPLEVFLLTPLVKNQLITNAEINKFKKNILLQECYEYAIKLLAKQEYCSYSLESKLVKKFEGEIVKKVIFRLQENKYIDDQQYMLSYFENCFKKGYATKNIVFKLSLLGYDHIPQDLVDKYTALEEEQAYALGQYYLKVHPKIDADKRKIKLYSLLLARGYDEELIRQVFKRLEIVLLQDY